MSTFITTQRWNKWLLATHIRYIINMIYYGITWYTEALSSALTIHGKSTVRTVRWEIDLSRSSGNFNFLSGKNNKCWQFSIIWFQYIVLIALLCTICYLSLIWEQFPEDFKIQFSLKSDICCILYIKFYGINNKTRKIITCICIITMKQ